MRAALDLEGRHATHEGLRVLARLRVGRRHCQGGLKSEVQHLATGKVPPGQACFTAGLGRNTYGTGCFMLMHTGARFQTSGNGLNTTSAAQATPKPEFALEGSVFIGGAVVQWLRDGLGAIQGSHQVQALAENVPDAGGVMFVPAFTGPGAPYWEPQLRCAHCAHCAHVSRWVNGPNARRDDASAAAAIRPGDDLEPVPVRVVPIDAAPAIGVVDPARLLLAGIGPVRQAALADAPEDSVELVLADEKRVVLHFDVARRLNEIEGDGIVELDAEKRADAHRRRAAEHLGQKPCRGLRIPRRNDGVIELDRHGVQRWSIFLVGRDGQAVFLALPRAQPYQALGVKTRVVEG